MTKKKSEVSESTKVARRKALRSLQDPVHSEAPFACLHCGKTMTLRFDEYELEELNGDIKSYTGPCPNCDAMTLSCARAPPWGG